VADNSSMIEGVLPSGGRRFAAVDPAARYARAAVGERRFSALLTPFRTRKEAIAALRAIGAVVEGEQE